jgi:hypothetical protein
MVCSVDIKLGMKVEVKVLEFERVAHFQGDCKSTSIHRALVEFVSVINDTPLDIPPTPSTQVTQPTL